MSDTTTITVVQKVEELVKLVRRLSIVAKDQEERLKTLERRQKIILKYGNIRITEY